MDDLKLYTLSEAAKMLGASVTKGKLLTEIKRGRLPCRKVGATTYVTESDMREMTERCLVDQKDHTCGGENKKDAKASGLSRTTDAKKAQDAARASLKMLKNNSRNTSRKNGHRQAGKASLHS